MLGVKICQYNDNQTLKVGWSQLLERRVYCRRTTGSAKHTIGMIINHCHRPLGGMCIMQTLFELLAVVYQRRKFSDCSNLVYNYDSLYVTGDTMLWRSPLKPKTPIYRRNYLPVFHRALRFITVFTRANGL